MGPPTFGRAVRRVEDPRLVTGAGTYVDDRQPANLVHAAFLRSYLANAVVRRLDVTGARQAPGVLAAWTDADLQELGSMPTEAPEEAAFVPERRPLANGRVHHVGQPVAVVIAESRQQARDAIDRIEMDLEPLPAVADVETATAPKAALVYPEAPGNISFTIRKKRGAVAAAFKKAEVVVRQRLHNQRLIPMAMETRGALATMDGSRLTVEISSQAPHSALADLAAGLRMDPADIRVIVPEVGGGFGSKGGLYSEELVVAEAARRLRRPVKWIEDRTENCSGTWQARGHVQEVELAALRDGTVLALRSQIRADMGTLAGFGPMVPVGTIDMLTGCYKIPALESTLTGVFTNTTPTSAYRGAGRPEATYLIERMMDLLAVELGRDPAEVRKHNFIGREAFPYRNPAGTTYDSGDYAGTLDRLLAMADYPRLRRDQAAARQAGRLHGIGMAAYVDIGGGGPADRSAVHLEMDGSLTVYTGSTPHGQGHETTWAQLAADVFGLPLERVRVRHGDTDHPSYAQGTWGSRSAATSGAAVLNGTRTLKRQVVGLAASALEAAEADLVLEDGRVYVRGVPSRALSLERLAAWALAQDREAELRANEEFDSPDYVFPFGAHLAVVEVDRDTGRVQILRYLAVDDCGVVINPMIVEGQVHGGTTQGIAQALFEEAAFDPDGQLLTGNLTTYLVPAAPDVPRFELDRTVTPTPRNPIGAKGIGESGTLAAPPTIVNAVMDALGPLGIRHLDMPLTPAKVWEAIRAAPG
ncbi:MAG: xanthine dehydrogenase family protein molybdopterin-binding subunit [Chloroflexi bacterium]|nr:MAG: xanthine dehydrogenase family protein molybdopterin-binding subunit [Chloroflexota bacterium]